MRLCKCELHSYTSHLSRSTSINLPSFSSPTTWALQVLPSAAMSYFVYDFVKARLNVDS